MTPGVIFEMGGGTFNPTPELFFLRERFFQFAELLELQKYGRNERINLKQRGLRESHKDGARVENPHYKSSEGRKQV